MKCLVAEKSSNSEVGRLFNRRFSVEGISFDHLYLSEGLVVSPENLLPGFNILNWATPEPPGSRYRSIKRIRLEGKDFILRLRQSSAWYPSSYSQSEVISDDDKNSFAEVVTTSKGYHIYLLFNLIHDSSDQTGASIRPLLKALIRRCFEFVPVPSQLLEPLTRQLMKMEASVREDVQPVEREQLGNSPGVSRKRESLFRKIQFVQKIPTEINLLNTLEFVSDMELSENAFMFSLLPPQLIKKGEIKVALFLNGRWATSYSRCWGPSYKLLCLSAASFQLASLAGLLYEFYERNGWGGEDD